MKTDGVGMGSWKVRVNECAMEIKRGRERETNTRWIRPPKGGKEKKMLRDARELRQRVK